jgi:hypothetical protein
MGIFKNDYNDAHQEFSDYVDRNGNEPEPAEYNRLSQAVDDAAEHTPWWQRI